MGTTNSSAVRGLGEIALRVSNLEAMQTFYQEIVGLELMKRFPTAAFFRIADGYGGHTQILALFDRAGGTSYIAPEKARTTVDHIAFTIDLADFETEKTRLESLGQPLQTATHAWVQWRSLYISDPEGNTVEFVCFDPSISKNQ